MCRYIRRRGSEAPYDKHSHRKDACMLSVVYFAQITALYDPLRCFWHDMASLVNSHSGIDAGFSP
jgi:hypothetical protein